MFEKLKGIIRKLKQEIIPIYYALFDKRTPIIAKVFAGITVGYLLSPIDLIPDFIPVLGLLDDLIIVPILIKFTLTLIPKYIIEDVKTKIDNQQKLTQKWYYALPIILIYIVLIILTIRHFEQ
jgi:uncharacterized membrane protein YkvA (DUF1232 family)